MVSREESEINHRGLNVKQKIVFQKGEILRSVIRPYYLSEMDVKGYYYMVEDVIGDLIICSRVHRDSTGWKKLFRETFMMLDFAQGYIRRTKQ